MVKKRSRKKKEEKDQGEAENKRGYKKKDVGLCKIWREIKERDLREKFKRKREKEGGGGARRRGRR